MHTHELLKKYSPHRDEEIKNMKFHHHQKQKQDMKLFRHEKVD